MKTLFTLFIITFPLAGFSQSKFNLDQFESVYIQNFVFNGYNYEDDGLGIKRIIQTKLEKVGIPISPQFDPHNCRIVLCEIFYQSNLLTILFSDCNTKTLFFSEVPFHLKDNIGPDEIPRLQPRLVAAVKKAVLNLTGLDTYEYNFNPEAKSRKLNVEIIDFTLEEFKDYLKSATDPREGEYEVVSLDFPECILGVKKQEERYLVFYIEVYEIGWYPKEVVCLIAPTAGANKFTGTWQFKDGNADLISAEFSKKKKLIITFENALEDPVIFEKKRI